MPIIGAIGSGVTAPPPPEFLGEPTGWEGPYTSFGSNTVHGTAIFSGNPLQTAADTNDNQPSWYFDVVTKEWKNYDGIERSLATGTEFAGVPPDATANANQPPWDVINIDGTNLLYRWGAASGVSGRACTFDLSGNSVSEFEDDGTTVIRYTSVSTQAGESWCMAKGKDGNIYGFFGVDNNNNNFIGHICRYQTGVRSWTETGDDVPDAQGLGAANGRVGAFAVSLADGRIWTGGGSNQTSGSGVERYNTWFFDTDLAEGSRLSAGPAIPYTSDGFIDTVPVILDTGEVYLPGWDNCYIFNPTTLQFRVALAELPTARNLGQNTSRQDNLMQLPDGRLLFVTDNTRGTWISTHD